MSLVIPSLGLNLNKKNKKTIQKLEPRRKGILEMVLINKGRTRTKAPPLGTRDPTMSQNINNTYNNHTENNYSNLIINNNIHNKDKGKFQTNHEEGVNKVLKFPND